MIGARLMSTWDWIALAVECLIGFLVLYLLWAAGSKTCPPAMPEPDDDATVDYP